MQAAIDRDLRARVERRGDRSSRDLDDFADSSPGDRRRKAGDLDGFAETGDRRRRTGDLETRGDRRLEKAEDDRCCRRDDLHTNDVVLNFLMAGDRGQETA